ncbi:MAG: peptidylprolyl isomerase [Terrimicrobiaceae bacterium]
MKFHQVSLLAALALAPALAFAQDKPGDSDSAAIVLKDPVAIVNGEKITKDELDNALNEAVKASGIKAEDLTAEQKMEGYRQILDDMIMDKLLTKASEGITVPKEQIDAEVAKLKAQFPSEDAFQKQLDSVGQTPEKLTAALGKMMQQRQWVESKIGKAADVTDADAKKFYDENKSEFEQPEQVKASHILLRVDNEAPEETVKSQLEKANAAAARVKKGESFADVAKEISEEPGAKESGGDLGYFSKDRMVPEFAEASFKLKPGEISEPVRTQFGWHIIKVEDRKPAGTATFDEVKNQLIAYLKSDKQRKAVNDLMKTLREDAKIENTLPVPDAGE